MSETPAQRALTASTIALVVAVGCLAMFLPPLVKHTTDNVLRTVAVSLALALSLGLHWVFLGIAVRRMGRSMAGWLSLGIVLFPIGGAAALILLSWFAAEGPLGKAAAPSAHHG